MKEIIKVWKELNVSYIDFNFNCGGDSMNDVDILIYDDKGTEIGSQELKDYFDEETYKQVEFYVNSDGHYQGEAGVVRIELAEDDDEPYFTYSKEAESEWNENVESVINIPLTDEEFLFIKNNVSRISGEERDINIVYTKDIILNDEKEKLVDELENKILDIVDDFTPELEEGELMEYYTFETNDDMLLDDNNSKFLIISISNSVIIFRDSNE